MFGSKSALALGTSLAISVTSFYRCDTSREETQSAARSAGFSEMNRLLEQNAALQRRLDSLAQGGNDTCVDTLRLCGSLLQQCKETAVLVASQRDRIFKICQDMQ